MGRVIVNAAVSLDGFIADDAGGVGPLFDFYVNGDVSADGHNWSTSAIANDYVEKLWPNSYGRRREHYDYEGGEPAGYQEQEHQDGAAYVAPPGPPPGPERVPASHTAVRLPIV